MLNKTLITVILTSCFNLTFSSIAQASNCGITVAEINKTEAIEQVRIKRASNNEQQQWASKNNRLLCPGDKVIVPKNLANITITYYSYVPYQEKLTAGQKYTVKALHDPCGALCKAKEKLANLWLKLKTIKLFSPTDDAGGRGNYSTTHIFTPLADGAGSKEPFYLFAREGSFPLFWKGGKSPYNLTVKDNKGQILIQKTLKSAKFSFTTLIPEHGLEYTLTIKSTKDKTCQKHNSKFCEKKLIFTVPPFPLDSQEDKFMQLTKLLGDCKKNWRLEIWRQLTAMPNTDNKQAFMTHLRDNDVGPYNRDIGLCK